MDDLILKSIFTLSAIGIFSAVFLYLVSKKFFLKEDPLVKEIVDLLPGANCSGCGLPGCQQFAEEVVKNKTLTGFSCPVSGDGVMEKIANALGVEVVKGSKKFAIIKCNGTNDNVVKKADYEGIDSCHFAHKFSMGTSGCEFGCLHLGDCATACDFDAISIDPNRGIPVIIEEKCKACGVCVLRCPRGIIELREVNDDDSYSYVACSNKERGAEAKKSCKVPCIGCSKCAKIYETDAVSVENFLSYIGEDFDLATYGEKLKNCCPTKAIVVELKDTKKNG